MLTKNSNSQICLCFSQSSALTLTAVRLVYVFIPDGRVFGEGGPESRALRQDWLKTKRQFNNVKLKSKQQKSGGKYKNKTENKREGQREQNQKTLKTQWAHAERREQQNRAEEQMWKRRSDTNQQRKTQLYIHQGGKIDEKLVKKTWIMRIKATK